MHCTQCGQALAADEQFCPVCGAPREASGMTFEQAEQEYFRLRGQLDTRRITQEQFESALKNLMVQDAQGRYWMLGVDSGAWYVYDGRQWVRNEPTAPTGSPPSAPRSSSAPFVILGIVALLLLTLLALGAYWFLLPRNSGAGLGNQTVALLTSAPVPTLAPVILPGTSVSPNAPPTSALPTVLLPTIRPTHALPPTALLPTPPTEAALPIITLPVSTIVVVKAATATIPPSTEIPTAAATRTSIPPTRTPLPTNTPAPTNVPTPAFPPGVYATRMDTEPAEPKRNQAVTFLVTFVNTTGATQQYNWLVQIYDAESNKRFGETLVQGLTVPPGESVQTSPDNWQVTGAGDCISLYAQAQFQNADTGRIPFTATNGDAFSQWFSVCP